MKQYFFLLIGSLTFFTTSLAQVDNDILFNASGNDYDKSSYNLTPTRKNVISHAGRFGNSVTWPSLLFEEEYDSYLDYGRPEHLKNTSDFSMSLWYGGRPKSIQDVAVIFNKYDIKLTLNDLTGPTVNGIVDEDWASNAYNASSGKFKIGYVNSWHHLVVIKENDVISLYRDNELIGSKEYAPASNASSDSVLMGKGFTGEIDHVTIYDGAISKEEINYLFNNNQDFTGISTNCPDKLFLSPVGATFLEGDRLAFCNAPSVTLHFTTEVQGYGTINGQFSVLYPDGANALYSGGQISLTEAGSYSIRLLTENNCILEKTFELLPTIDRPTLTFAKDHYCSGSEDALDLTVPIVDVTENINGVSKLIEFDLYKDFDLVDTYKAEDNRIPISSGGIYKVKVKYEGCINGSLYTESLIVDEEECEVTGVNKYKVSIINVHPNPTNGILYIDNVEEEVEISLISSQGQAMKEKVKGGQIDLSKFKQGLYNLIIYNGNEVYNKSIIVQ